MNKIGESSLKARIHITLKNGVLDPQGKAVNNALETLGFRNVDQVRQGKYIEIDLIETDKNKAGSDVDSMCRQLLANTVIEDYHIEIID